MQYLRQSDKNKIAFGDFQNAIRTCGMLLTTRGRAG